MWEFEDNNRVSIMPIWGTIHRTIFDTEGEHSTLQARLVARRGGVVLNLVSPVQDKNYLGLRRRLLRSSDGCDSVSCVHFK